MPFEPFDRERETISSLLQEDVSLAPAEAYRDHRAWRVTAIGGKRPAAAISIELLGGKNPWVHDGEQPYDLRVSVDLYGIKGADGIKPFSAVHRLEDQELGKGSASLLELVQEAAKEAPDDRTQALYIAALGAARPAKSIESIDDAREILGADKVDAVLEKHVPRSGLVDYYWDVNEDPVDEEVLQGWFDDCLSDQKDGMFYQPAAIAAAGGLSVQECFEKSLCGYVDELLVRAEDYDGISFERGYIRDAITKDLGRMAATEGYYGLESIDIDADAVGESLDPLLEDVVTGFDYHVEDFLSDRVPVDLLIATPGEMNGDLSAVGEIARLHDDCIGTDVKEAEQDYDLGWLADTGVGKLCEAQGIPLAACWDPAQVPEGSRFAESLRKEVANTNPNGMMELCAMPELTLGQWAALEGARLFGIPFQVTLDPADGMNLGIYDRVNGGGSLLGIELDKPMTLSSIDIDDVAIDGSRVLVGNHDRYSIQDTYGDVAWAPCDLKVEGLERDAQEALQEAGKNRETSYVLVKDDEER